MKIFEFVPSSSRRTAMVVVSRYSCIPKHKGSIGVALPCTNERYREDDHEFYDTDWKGGIDQVVNVW